MRGHCWDVALLDSWRLLDKGDTAICAWCGATAVVRAAGRRRGGVCGAGAWGRRARRAAQALSSARPTRQPNSRFRWFYYAILCNVWNVRCVWWSAARTRALDGPGSGFWVPNCRVGVCGLWRWSLRQHACRSSWPQAQRPSLLPPVSDTASTGPQQWGELGGGGGPVGPVSVFAIEVAPWLDRLQLANAAAEEAQRPLGCAPVPVHAHMK